MTSAAPARAARSGAEPALDASERRAELPAREPLGLLAEAIHRGLEPSVYWSDADETVIGLGVAEEVRTDGADRLARLDDALAARGEGGRWFGGFAFEDAPSPEFSAFGSARFFRPRVVWRLQRGAVEATLGLSESNDDFLWRKALDWASSEVEAPDPNRAPAAASPEDRERWQSAVEAGLGAIRSGMLRKVVLSRRIEVRAEAPFDVPAVLAALPRRNAAEAAFALFAGGGCFLGLTPERLIRVEGDRAWTEALAGTSPADDPDGLALLTSEKDLEEHRHVLDHLTSRLGPLARTVEAAPEPTVRRLGTLAHLCTPILAHGVAGRRLLDLAGALHPTPAVGGVPPRTAAGVIATAEGRPRGLYAGGIGWVAPGPHGQARCELRVALRSALLDGRRALVFVGAGIVAGSTEASEWRETALKATRTLEALGA